MMAQTFSPAVTAGSGRLGQVRVMVVGEDLGSAELVGRALRAAGYEVLSAMSGTEAVALLERARPDLVMLGIVLPDVDGLVLCSHLLTRWSVPIVMLSGTKRHRDRILSLRLGADDFIAAPFDPQELIARIEAILRRVPGSRSERAAGRAFRQVGEEAQSGTTESEGVMVQAGAADASRPTHRVYQFGELAIDHGRRSVTIGGAPVHLTPTEHRLLSLLISDPGHVFGRDALAEAVWGHANLGESRAIDVHIRRLRSKLEPFGGHAPLIVTVRGFGYKVVPGLALNEPWLAARPGPSWASTDSQPEPLRNNCAGV